MTRCYPVLLALLVGAPAQAAVDAHMDGRVLVVQTSAGDDVAVTCETDAALTKINGADPAASATNPTPRPTPCAQVTAMELTGDALANELSLAALTLAQFPALQSATLSGRDGDDVLAGSPVSDQVSGGDGNDILQGGGNPTGLDILRGDAGDDTVISQAGGGDDFVDGGIGDDTAIVEGEAVGETYDVRDNRTVVLVERAASAPVTAFSVRLTRDTEHLVLRGNDGDDVVDASNGPGEPGLAGVIDLTLRGGAGADVLTGGNGADQIHGDAGDDVLVGFVGADAVSGEAGGDTLIWNGGDGSDRNDGGDEDAAEDRVVVNGGGNADPFLVGPNVVGGTFFPEFALDGFELLFVRNPGFHLNVRGAEVLEVNGGSGGDTIDAGALPANVAQLELYGEDGNDVMTGSAGADILHGGDGDDTLTGFAGADRVHGFAGADVMIWNPGDGSDLNDGGVGDGADDRVVVNGGAGGDPFLIGPNRADGAFFPEFAVDGYEVLFVRNPGFHLNLLGVDTLEVNGRGGDDTLDARALEAGLGALVLSGGDGEDAVLTAPMAGIGQTLTGGAPDVPPGDTLHVAGVPDPRLSPIELPGFAPIAHAEFELFVTTGGSVAGVVYDDLDASGTREPGEPGLDGVNVFDDLDGDRRLDAGEAATLTALDGSYRLERSSDGEVRVRAAVPPDAARFLSTGVEPAAIALENGVVIEGVDLGYFRTLAPGERSASAKLGADQVVPPLVTTGAASGRVRVVFDPDGIDLTLRFAGLSGPATAAHVHGPAAAGAVGEVLGDLVGVVGATDAVVPTVSYAVTPEILTALAAGTLYVDIHTAAAPDGEVRGQLLLDRTYDAALSASQQVPATASTAVGDGSVTLLGTGDEIRTTVSYEGLGDVDGPSRSVGVMLRGPAARGEIGEPIADAALRTSDADNDHYVAAPRALGAEERAELEAGLWYLDVRSVAFPEGEIRGQLDDRQFVDGFESR